LDLSYNTLYDMIYDKSTIDRRSGVLALLAPTYRTHQRRIDSLHSLYLTRFSTAYTAEPNDYQYRLYILEIYSPRATSLR